MGIVEMHGGPVTQRYLMNKTKEDLAGEYLQVLEAVDRLRDRLVRAEAILRALQPHIRAMELDLGYDQIFSDRINAFLSDGE